MLPPKSGLWPLFSSPPSIPSCLRLLQPEGILPQPASGRTCPSPLPFSSSGDGRSSDGRGRREARTQQGLWLGGGGALLLPSLCHHAPLTPPHHCPSIFQVSSPKLPLPPALPGASRDPVPQSMVWDSRLFSKAHTAFFSSRAQPHAKPQ